MNQNTTSRQKDDVASVEVSGKLIRDARCDELWQKICNLAEIGRKRIFLHVAGVTHIDSFGMGELVAAYTTLTDAGGQMKLLSVGPRIEPLLRITSLNTVSEIYEDEASALRSFSSPESAHHEARTGSVLSSELFLAESKLNGRCNYA
jgi:anti-sigma B factor antagonist